MFKGKILDLKNFSIFSCGGKCAGCKIDTKPPISTKNRYQKGWESFKELVSYDLTSNAISTIWMILDVSSDIETGVEHWKKEHRLWALASWLFMFVPLMISFVMEIVLQRCKCSMERLWKVFGHIPLCQIFYHFNVLKKLNAERKTMQEKKEYYNNIKYDEFKEEDKSKLLENAKKFVESKEKYAKLMSDLQDQKLYEGFAESAPQFSLQLCIIFIQGKCSLTVFRSIITSFVSLTKCAMSSFLTMSTKGREIKEGSWKTKLFFALPSMLFVVTPRLIALGILATYLKEWIFLVVVLMVAFNFLLNWRFLARDQKDPKKVVLGCISNVFAPVVVVEDCSAFFLKSSLISTLLYITSLIILSIVVLCGGLDSTPMLTPCNTTQPSIFHCFDDIWKHENYTVLRCPLTPKGQFDYLFLF